MDITRIVEHRLQRITTVSMITADFMYAIGKYIGKEKRVVLTTRILFLKFRRVFSLTIEKYSQILILLYLALSDLSMLQLKIVEKSRKISN